MAKKGVEGRMPGDYYSGRMFERDFIGVVDDTNPAFRDAWRAIARDDRGYAAYGDALALARKFQPSEPTNPNKAFGREFRVEVTDELGLPPEQYDSVRFYTAVNTPLDYWHGVDCWIEVENPETHEVRRVTLDLSLRPRKTHKANLLVEDLPAPEGETEKAFLDEVVRHAKDAAALLRSPRAHAA